MPMHIRTFRAANLQAALSDIRDQMGPEASVLHTRQIRDGWMGWLGRTQVEVTAGLAPRRSSEGDASDRGSAAFSAHAGSAEPADVRRLDVAHGHAATNHGAGQGGASQRIASRYAPASSADSISAHSMSDGGIDHWQTTETFASDLIAAGVSGDVARRWLMSASSFAANLNDRPQSEADDRARWWEHLQRAVARELNLSGPIRTQPGERHVVALVGPTGVGKTTTVAKLAAGFRIQARRRVGLLTIDTYRIAAVQQLRAYAEIMDLPMQVVESPDQMAGAMTKLGDVDLVLIDTAGRSPRSDARVQQLQGFLRAAQPDETHLVLSATSSAESIRTTLEGFTPVSATSVILTKLDETPSTAAVLSALTRGERGASTPLSYVTNGQQVPDDIAVADASMLVSSLLPIQSSMLGMMSDLGADDYVLRDVA